MKIIFPADARDYVLARLQVILDDVTNGKVPEFMKPTAETPGIFFVVVGSVVAPAEPVDYR